MKKSILIILLTILTLGLFRPVTALAEDQKLPSGTERSQIGQKIKTLSRNMKDNSWYGNNRFLQGRDYLPKVVLAI